VAAIDRFARDFARWMHGDVRIKDDTAVSAADVEAHHLILFGDPGSNRLLGQIAERLPIRWAADVIVVGKETYAAADHVLVMIYPNPLNPRRYVVVNSGHTFHEAEFRGSNAQLYPRLGDFAVLRLDPGRAGNVGGAVGSLRRALGTAAAAMTSPAPVVQSRRVMARFPVDSRSGPISFPNIKPRPRLGRNE
jgi:hypothetical protein